MDSLLYCHFCLLNTCNLSRFMFQVLFQITALIPLQGLILFTQHKFRKDFSVTPYTTLNYMDLGIIYYRILIFNHMQKNFTASTDKVVILQRWFLNKGKYPFNSLIGFRKWMPIQFNKNSLKTGCVYGTFMSLGCWFWVLLLGCGCWYWCCNKCQVLVLGARYWYWVLEKAVMMFLFFKNNTFFIILY